MKQLEKLKKWCEKQKAPSQMERINQSIRDSIESRRMLEDEAGNEIEDVEYLADLISLEERTGKRLVEEKEAKKWLKLKLPDSQVTSAVIKTTGDILIFAGNLTFALICLKIDTDGEIVPTRLFQFLKQIKK